MSDLNAFAQHLQQDSDLLEQLRNINGQDTLVERVVKEGQALGYDLKPEEVRQRLNTGQHESELTDADLDSVTGGAKGGDNTVTQPPCSLMCIF